MSEITELTDFMTSPLPEKELEYLWQSSMHEDKLFSQRVYFLSVAQSMLLFAFATIVTSSVAGKSLYAIILSMVGILTSIFWFYSSYMADKYTIKPIGEILDKNPQFCARSIIVSIRNEHRSLRSNVVFGRIFPIMFIATWLALLGVALTF